MTKYINNPILTPQDVVPSQKDLKVDGIFNCGATKYNDEFILLCRVAESFITNDENIVSIPIIKNENGKDIIKRVDITKTEHPEYDFSDSRSVWSKDDKSRKMLYLTSLSHIRLARSKDGYNFVLDNTPSIMPRAKDEEWGIEDPRVTLIDGVYYINYTSVTSKGAATSLITTSDFINYKREGIIFAPENKDVTIFPNKIDGKYYAFNRPVPSAIGYPDMWIAKSFDLIHWGEQEHFYGVNVSNTFENGRIGGGAVPILTTAGWIKIYHAADKNNRYCLGAFLLDKDNPQKIIAKSSEPILEPTEKYEIEGFFGNVVFTCGCVVEDNNIYLYYGAADDKICVATTTIDELLSKIDMFNI